MSQKHNFKDVLSKLLGPRGIWYLDNYYERTHVNIDSYKWRQVVWSERILG